MLSKIGIIGSGTMGIGIAQVAAMAGCEVIVVDIKSDQLQKAKNTLSTQLGKLLEKGTITASDLTGIFGRCYFVDQISACSDCELIIEAIVEDYNVKATLYQQIEACVADTCIIASNTSSLSITALASKLKVPSRFIGVHFFNPAPVMKLVEVIPAMQTDPKITSTIVSTIESWEKQIVLAKDSPGFIVNKVARPYYGEALRCFEEGIGTPLQIDYAMTSQGFKMGPFALMDLIGLDVNLAVTKSVWESFFYDSRYKPSFIQKQMVDAGYLGKKSGKGFYDYSMSLPSYIPTEDDEPQLDYIFNRIVCMLINEAADTVQKGICNEADVDTAMRYGTNYPKGLLAWAEELEYEHIVRTLDNLYDRYHEERYRASPYLRDRIALN